MEEGKEKEEIYMKKDAEKEGKGIVSVPPVEGGAGGEGGRASEAFAILRRDRLINSQESPPLPHASRNTDVARPLLLPDGPLAVIGFSVILESFVTTGTCFIRNLFRNVVDLSIFTSDVSRVEKME